MLHLAFRDRPRARRIAVVVLVFSALVALTWNVAAAQAQPIGARTARGDTLVVGVAAPFTLRDGVRDAIPGTLSVPERRGHAGRRIALHWLRFPSSGTESRAPIVFLAGGPGDASSRAFATMPVAYLDSLRAIADVIAFDQRGTGLSEPDMRCAPDGALRLDVVPTRATRDSHARAAAARCLDTVRARGADLAGYTTRESADDLESLRVALGVPKLALLGGSYGTHLGLWYLRMYPLRVSAAVLAGVEGYDDTRKLPGNVDEAFAAVSRAAAADGSFAGRDSLHRVFDRLRARIDSAPMLSPPAGPVIMTSVYDLQRFVADALGDMRLILALPAQLYALDLGNMQALARATVRNRQARPLHAMKIAMDCASGASVARQARIVRDAASARLGDVIDLPGPSLCTLPGLPDMGEAARAAPGPIAAPVLFISGSLDGRTPPSNAESLLRVFPRGRHVAVDGQSHSLMGDPDVMRVTYRFLRGLDVPSTRIARAAPAFTR